MGYREEIERIYKANMQKTSVKREEFMQMGQSPKKMELSNLFQQLDGLKEAELTAVDQSQLNSIKNEIARIEKNINEFG